MNFYHYSLLPSFLTFTSCRNNNEDDSSSETKGKLQLKFDGFNNLGNIVLNQTTQTSSSGQNHQFSTLKYVISKISLIDENGNEFKYNENNPDKGAFIINQENAVAGIIYVDLDEIPKNNYKK